MRYQTRPITINAALFHGLKSERNGTLALQAARNSFDKSLFDDFPVWLQMAVTTFMVSANATSDGSLLVQTPFGTNICRPGDYIIKAPDTPVGTLSVIKPDAFRARYIPLRLSVERRDALAPQPKASPPIDLPPDPQTFGNI